MPIKIKPKNKGNFAAKPTKKAPAFTAKPEKGDHPTLAFLKSGKRQ